MISFQRETPAGPVLEIHMQGPDGFWCGECGDDDIPQADMTGERIIFDDGTAGWRPVCKACAKRLGIDSHE